MSVLWVVWLLAVTAILVGVVLLALGRGKGLAEQDLDDVVVGLPEDRQLVAADVDSVRLPLAIRGYRMSDVDEVLDRLAAELAVRDATIRELASRQSEGSSPGDDGVVGPPRES